MIWRNFFQWDRISSFSILCTKRSEAYYFYTLWFHEFFAYLVSETILLKEGNWIHNSSQETTYLILLHILNNVAIRILRGAKYEMICHVKEKINHSWRHSNCNWSAESFKFTIAASTFLCVVQSFKHLLFKNIFEISFWVAICTTYIDMFGNFSHSNLFHVSLHFINFSFQNIVKDLCSSSEGGKQLLFALCKI